MSAHTNARGWAERHRRLALQLREAPPAELSFDMQRWSSSASRAPLGARSAILSKLIQGCAGGACDRNQQYTEVKVLATHRWPHTASEEACTSVFHHELSC